MSWTPISNTVPQYEDAGIPASGFYLKFYLSGTVTPTPMATDSTGITTLDKCLLSVQGYPLNGSSAVFIPHIDRKYKLILYRNETDADNNTTVNAVWIVDSLTPFITGVDIQADNVADLRETEPTVDGQQASLIGHTTPGIDGGVYFYDASDTTSPDNDDSVIVTPEGKRWKIVSLAKSAILAPVNEILNENITQIDTGTYAYQATRIGRFASLNEDDFSLYSAGDRSAFAYGLDRASVIDHTDENLASNGTTAETQIAQIKLPMDSGRLTKRTRITIAVDVDVAVSSSEILVGFSDIRVKFTLVCRKTFSGTSAIMDFYINPVSASSFTIEGIAPNSPDTLPFTSGYMDQNLLSEFVMPVYIKYASTSPASVITSISATATTGPLEPSESNPSGLYMPAAVKPFSLGDAFNSPLSNRTIAKSLVATYDKGNLSGAHGSVTAGSDMITVADSTGVQVGDLAVVGTAQGAVYDPFTTLANFNDFSMDGVDTLTLLGEMAYVIDVPNSTTVQISRNSKTTISYSGVSFSNVVDTFAFMSPVTACIINSSTDNDTWATSVSTGMDKASSKAVPFPGRVQVWRTKATDPLVRFDYGQLNTPNPFIFPISDDADTSSSFGELIQNGHFEMHTPVEFTGTFSSSQNSDRNACFITPCGRYAVETFLTNDDGDGSFSCSRVSVSDLYGLSNTPIEDRPEYASDGFSNYTRAYGGSLMAGLIRKEDLDLVTYTGNIQYDIDNAMNAIKHGVAMVISGAQAQSNNYTATPGDQGTITTLNSYEGYINSPTIAVGGSDYVEGDVIKAAGGDFLVPMHMVVTGVSSGAVTSVFVTHTGQYRTSPPSPTSVATTTDGAGTGCIVNASVGGFSTMTDLMQMAAYPASVADNGFSSNYAGSIPMGATFTIDPELKLAEEWQLAIEKFSTDGAGLVTPDKYSYEYLAVLAAIQKYGAVVVDITENTCLSVNFDDKVTAEQRARVHGDRGSFTFNNLSRLTRRLRFVENRAPKSTDVEMEPLRDIAASPNPIG